MPCVAWANLLRRHASVCAARLLQRYHSSIAQHTKRRHRHQHTYRMHTASMHLPHTICCWCTALAQHTLTAYATPRHQAAPDSPATHPCRLLHVGVCPVNRRGRPTYVLHIHAPAPLPVAAAAPQALLFQPTTPAAAVSRSPSPRRSVGTAQQATHPVPAVSCCCHTGAGDASPSPLSHCGARHRQSCRVKLLPCHTHLRAPLHV